MKKKLDIKKLLVEKKKKRYQLKKKKKLNNESKLSHKITHLFKKTVIKLKQSSEKQNKVKIRMTITSKMLIVIIPSIIFVLVTLGVVATKEAKEMVNSGLKVNAEKTITQSQLYVDQIKSRIEELSNSIASDTTELQDKKGNNVVLAAVLGDNTVGEAGMNAQELSRYKTNINKVLTPITKQNTAISSIWILRENQINVGVPLIDEKHNQGDFKFDVLFAYDYIKDIPENQKGKLQWLPLHKEEIVTSHAKDVVSLVRYIRTTKFVNNTFMNAILVVNIGTDVFEDVVTSFEEVNTDNSLIMVLDSKGNVLAHPDKTKITTSLSEEGYIKDIYSAESKFGSFQDGKNYIAYSKSESSGWVIVTVTPLSSLLKSISTLQGKILLIGLALLAIATISVLLLTLDFRKTIRTLIVSMRKVEEGDLTIRTRIERGDEFGDLSVTFDNMVRNIKRIIAASTSTTNEVEKISSNVFSTSQINSQVAKQISGAIENVSEGLESQVTHVNDGILVAENLSDKINQVIDYSKIVEESSLTANSLSNRGKETVKELKDSTDTMNDVIKAVINSVDDLGESSSAIGEIVQTITHISEETNLLSLNSSIEAARAGEAGRGFSVVASEVRKLAMQSANAAREIDQIIKGIKNRIDTTKSIADKVYNINSKQVQHVENTTKVFDEINLSIVNIQDQINNLSTAIEDMSNSKTRIHNAISNISEVAENSAAASEEIAAATLEQERSMDSLNNYVESLNNVINELKESVNKFVI